MSAELSTDTVAIGERDGRVILSFPKPVLWCALDTATAVAVGEALARASYKAQFKSDPDPKTPLLKIEIRKKLLKRTEHTLRSCRDQKRDDRYIAETVVNDVLREIT